MSNSKPQYILDECVSIKLPIPVCSTFVESKNVLGKGASDDEIFEYAKKYNLMVVTRDYWFAEKILAEGYPVLLLLFRNKWGIVEPTKNVSTLMESLFDKCTLALMTKRAGMVILP